MSLPVGVFGRDGKVADAFDRAFGALRAGHSLARWPSIDQIGFVRVAVHRAAAVNDEAKEASEAYSLLAEESAACGVAEMHLLVVVLADECAMSGRREAVRQEWSRVFRATHAACARRRRGQASRGMSDGGLRVELACRSIGLNDVRSKRRAVRLQPPEA